ncbi:AAA family ATPase [Trueperella pyogenes]
MKQKGRVVLYNLSQVTQAVTNGETVYFVEGEKDADNGHYITGHTFTTAPQGATNVDKADMTPLTGATVIAVVDKDKAGDKWASKLAAALDGVAKQLSFVRAKEGKDLSDHLAAGHTLDNLNPYEQPKRTTPNEEEKRYRLITRSLADVPLKRARFAWDGIIPVGGATVIGGIGGSGKSQVLAYVAANLTLGTLPGEFAGTPRNVLYVNATTEDGLSETIAPRLVAAGADMGRIHITTLAVDSEEDPTIPLLSVYEAFSEEVEKINPALIVFDPIGSSLEGKNDDAQDVRRLLHAVNALAQRHNLAAVGIVHPPKGMRRIEDAFGGSNQWRNSARAGYLIALDKNMGEIVMQCSKNNWGQDPDNLAFHFEQYDYVTDEGERAQTSFVAYDGITSTSAESILNRAPETEGDNYQDAREWLADYLGTRGTVPAVQVFKDGRRDGFSQDQLKRAKEKAGTTSRRFGNAWVWELKPSRTLAPLAEITPTFPHDSNEKSKGAQEREKGDTAPLRSLPLSLDIPTKSLDQNGQGSKGARKHRGRKTSPSHDAVACPVHGEPLDERGGVPSA